MPYLPLPLWRRNPCILAFLPPARTSVILGTSLISPLNPTSVVCLSVFYSQHQFNLTPLRFALLYSHCCFLHSTEKLNLLWAFPASLLGEPFVVKGGVLLPSTGVRENCRWDLSCAFQGGLSKGFLIQFINQNKWQHDNCRLEQHLSIGKGICLLVWQSPVRSLDPDWVM